MTMLIFMVGKVKAVYDFLKIHPTQMCLKCPGNNNGMCNYMLLGNIEGKFVSTGNGLGSDTCCIPDILRGALYYILSSRLAIKYA